MATIPDITVPSDSYLDLYIAASITVGTAIEIINKGSSTIYVQESTTQPSATSTDGVAITSVDKPWAVGIVNDGAAKIWVRSSIKGLTSKVSVVETE